MHFRPILLSLAFSALTVLGADKVAYLNLETVFNEYYRTLQENYLFEQQMRTYQDRLKMMEEEQQETVQKAKAARDAAEDDLSSQQEKEEARRKFVGYAERIREKEAEIMQFRETDGQQLHVKQASTIHALVLELTGKIKEYAKANGYTHVYEVSGQTSAQSPVLLVYPEDQDITAAVTQFVNNGHEKELQEAKKQIEELKAAK